jgi:ubiquinone/menaquinone biosynthesis C-methylase UbiE
MSSMACAPDIEAVGNGRHRIRLSAAPGVYIPHAMWETSYPVDLIREIHAIKGTYLCDEIMRDEDPGYVEHHLRHEVLAYVAPEEFSGKRILDFGCGSGASTMVLGRLLPACEIVGVELDDKLLRIARRRAEHYGRGNVAFLLSPSPDRLPDDLGQFDYVILSAVFEHMLPVERETLLPLIWRHLKPGGVLFMNETPHRFAPLEMHTTNLPLINYLPDALAHRAACRFSAQVDPAASWNELLRAGIRGGSVTEIMRILRRCGKAQLLDPRPGYGDRIDVWFGKLSRNHRWLKLSFRAAVKALKRATGIQFVPWLALAIRKG